MISVQFKIRNSENEVIKATLYVSPTIIPNTGSNSIIVGNSVRVGIGGSNIDPIISLFAAPYDVRLVGYNCNTQFSIDLSSAPSGSTVQASDYIV